MIVDKLPVAGATGVKVRLGKKHGVYRLVTRDGPIRATLALVNQADAIAGLCGESAYGAGDCKFNGAGNTLKCRR